MEAKIKSPGVLGIDAGGTFTDIVFLRGRNHRRCRLGKGAPC